MSEMVQSRVLHENVYTSRADAWHGALTYLVPGAPVYIWRVAPGEYVWTAVPDSATLPSDAEMVLHDHVPGHTHGADSHRRRCSTCRDGR